MGLADLFRKKWKHSDADVRASAVRELGAEEIDALVTVAREDADPTVRGIAIKKLNDPGILREIAREDEDESLRQLAGERADALLSGLAMGEALEPALAALAEVGDAKALAELACGASLEQVRQAALERLDDPRALAEVVRGAADPAIQSRALARIDDGDVLRGVALSEASKEVCVAALERLEDPGALELVCKKGRTKALRALARRRLDALTARREGSGATDVGVAAPSAEETAQKKLHARQVQLCQQVEGLPGKLDWAAAAAELERLQRQWAETGPEAEEGLGERFGRGVKTFAVRRRQADELSQQRAAERAERERQVAELERNMAAREALIAEAEALDPESGASELEGLRARWAELGPAPENRRTELEQRFGRACGAVESGARRKDRLAELKPRLEELVQRAEALSEEQRLGAALKRYEGLQDQWRRALAEARAEADAELLARFEAVGGALDGRKEEAQQRREQRQQENLVRLERAVERMEKAVEAKELSAVDRASKAGAGAARKARLRSEVEAEAELSKRYEAAREALAVRRQELRDAEEWKRWANIPKLEALCLKVEGLLEEEDLGKVAKELRAAQRAWKKVGPAPREKSEALWKRFKGAADKAYERCQEYFAQQEQQRGENLKAKEALCAEVEELQDSTDWNTTAEAIKAIQRRWKAIGPVPRSQSDALWKRFRAACDHFFGRRQEAHEELNSQRVENLQQKEALCEEAEALQDSSDWEAAADAIKGLQRRWKAIGPVPRSKSDALWKRFRAACDHFFDRRERRHDEERGENLKAKEALCGELEELAESCGWGVDEAEAPNLVEKVSGALARWREAGPVPRDAADPVWERFCEAWEKILNAAPEAFAGTELDPAANLKKRQRLVERAEELAGPEVSAEASAEDIAQQLQNALEANALRSGGEGVEGGNRLDEIKLLQQAWRRLGPVPAEQGKELAARFKAACDRVFERSRPAGREREQQRRGPAGKGPAGKGPAGRARGRGGRQREDVSDEQREANLVQKEALLERAEALAGAEEPAAGADEMRRIQREWKGIGPVPGAQAKTLWNRFRRACNTVLQTGTRRPKPEPVGDAPRPEPKPESKPVGDAPRPEAEAPGAKPEPNQ